MTKTGKKRHVLFIHGGGEGAYASDAKLADSLRKKLGAGYVVHFPKMPDEAEPDYETWKREIVRELTAMGDDAILVGHSIGGSVAIKLLTEPDGGLSVAGVFLVSTPFWHDHEVWHWKDVELRKDAAAQLPRGIPVFLYHGRDDEMVPFSHVEMYARVLPDAVVRRLDGRDHQLNDDLTEVARDIGALS